MSCRQIEHRLDDYLDGALPDADGAELENHARNCETCTGLLDSARTLRRRLRALPVEGPAPGFFERALATAARPQPARRGHGTARYAGAIAAGMAAVVVAGMLLRTPTPEPAAAPAGIAQIAMTVEERRTVNLVFASSQAVMELRLAVDLPPGVELASHPGRRTVRWTTELHEGKNVLPLDLIAVGGSGGELVATLRHGDSERVFRVDIDIDMG